MSLLQTAQFELTRPNSIVYFLTSASMGTFPLPRCQKVSVLVYEVNLNKGAVLEELENLATLKMFPCGSKCMTASGKQTK